MALDQNKDYISTNDLNFTCSLQESISNQNLILKSLSDISLNSTSLLSDKLSNQLDLRDELIHCGQTELFRFLKDFDLKDNDNMLLPLNHKSQTTKVLSIEDKMLLDNTYLNNFSRLNSTSSLKSDLNISSFCNIDLDNNRKTSFSELDLSSTTNIVSSCNIIKKLKSDSFLFKNTDFDDLIKSYDYNLTHMQLNYIKKKNCSEYPKNFNLKFDEEEHISTSSFSKSKDFDCLEKINIIEQLVQDEKYKKLDSSGRRKNIDKISSINDSFIAPSSCQKQLGIIQNPQKQIYLPKQKPNARFQLLTDKSIQCLASYVGDLTLGEKQNQPNYNMESSNSEPKSTLKSPEDCFPPQCYEK